MSRPARTSALAVAGLVGALLGAAPAHAAPGDPVAVYESAPSAYPVTLLPYSLTANATVYGVWGVNDELWIRPTGGAPAREDRLGEFPEVVGDLLQETYLMDHEGAITWRTTTDPTLQEHEIPAGLHAEEPTDRGYVAREDDSGDLVHVDLLDGGEVTPVGTLTGDMIRLTPGPQGVLSYGYGEGELRYFPYATPGTGRRLATQPAALEECPVVTATNAYCTRDDGLARYPLAGGAATTVATSDDYIHDMVSFAGGVAMRAYDSEGSPVLKTWTGTPAAPVERLSGTFRLALNGGLVATQAGTSVVVSRDGNLGQAGLWSIPVPTGSSSQVVAAPPSDRVARDIAVGPGAVAWADDARIDGSGWLRDLDADGNPTGSERLVIEQSLMANVAVAGGHVAFNPAVDGGFEAEVALWEDGTAASIGEPSADVRSFSGDRLLLKRYDFAEESTHWVIRDVRTGEVTDLPDAGDYDLWGERLVRLTPDGQVSVHDLRTDDVRVLRSATPAELVYGTVHVAGDTVVWDVQIGDDWESAVREQTMRNVDPLAAATPLVEGESVTVLDLSAGYALVSMCQWPDCGVWALPVDGTAPVLVSVEDEEAVVDGRTVAFLDEHSLHRQGTGTPSVVTLPAFPDAPRLLVDPELSSVAGAGRTWALRVVTSRVLTTCAVEIRDASDAVVRTLDCVDQYAAAEVAWDATDGDGDLLPPGEYTWEVTGSTGAEGLVDYDGGSAALSGTVTVSDNPAPTVTERSPAVDGHSVSAAGGVTATFSEAVTGVSDTTFRLRTPGGTVVPASVTYNPTTRRATLDPASNLAADSRYTAVLTGGESAIRDGAGGPLETTSWTFTTGPAPVLTKLLPANNGTAATLSGNITATMSENVAGLDGDSFVLRTPGGAAVRATVSWNSVSRLATLNPTANLLPDTRYTATLTGGAGAIRDQAGNPLTTRSWSFTTGPAPTVASSSPAANATKVSRTANVVVAFSEPVVGVSSTTVRLRTSSGTIVPATVTYSTTSRKATLNPSRTLAAGTKYTVGVAGGTTAIRDAAGNPLTTKSWSFTTGS